MYNSSKQKVKQNNQYWSFVKMRILLNKIFENRDVGSPFFIYYHYASMSTRFLQLGKVLKKFYDFEYDVCKI